MADRPLEDFVRAASENDSARMQSIVSTHRDELTKSFFGLINEAAKSADIDPETASKYLAVAALLSATYELQAAGDDLYQAIAEGRPELTGSARSIVSPHTLTEFVISAANGVRSGLLIDVRSDLQSLVEAYVATQLPPEMREFQRRLRAAFERRRAEESAREERERELDAKRRERERRAILARYVKEKDLEALWKMFNHTKRDTADYPDVVQALAEAGDKETLLVAARAVDADELVIRALGRLPGVEPIEALVPHILATDDKTRDAAVTTLTGIGAPSFSILRSRMMYVSNIDLRLAVARLLAKMKYEPATPEERACMLIAQRQLDPLTKLGAPAASVARQVIGSARSDVVIDALTVLGCSGTRTDVDAILPFLSHQNLDIQSAATTGLRRQYGFTPIGLFQSEWAISPTFRHVFFPGTALLLLILRRAIVRCFTKVFPSAVLMPISNVLDRAPFRGFAATGRDVMAERMRRRLFAPGAELQPAIEADFRTLGRWQGPLPQTFVDEWPRRRRARRSSRCCSRATLSRAAIQGSQRITSRNWRTVCVAEAKLAWAIPLAAMLVESDAVRESLRGHAGAQIVVAQDASDRGDPAAAFARLLRFVLVREKNPDGQPLQQVFARVGRLCSGGEDVQRGPSSSIALKISLERSCAPSGETCTPVT